MTLSTLGRLWRQDRSTRKTPRIRPHRLVLEPLEDRTLLTLLGLVPTLPSIDYNDTGRIDYDCAAERFDLTEAVPIDYVEPDQFPFNFRPVTGAFPDSLYFEIHIVVDSSGNLQGGVPGDDLELLGSIDINGDGFVDVSGPLLTGEICQFGFEDGGATNTDSYDFRFTITGGSLTTASTPNTASYFQGMDLGVTVTSEESTFAGSFESDFSGGAKGYIFPIERLPAGLGDYVWLDADADGIQDETEAGVAGVTVNLYSSDNTLVDTTTTDSAGLYLFDDLTPGDYYVEFIAPTDYEFTLQDAAENDLLDSDADSVTGRTAVTTLVSGEHDLSWDAGIVSSGVSEPPASLGDYVWHDTYHGPGHLVDGIQDADEDGIQNVTVNLLDGNGIFVASTTTNATGFYEFTDLDAGTYVVEIAAANFLSGGALQGRYATLQDRGSDDALDSDGDRTTYRSGPVTLAAGDDNPTIDFGFFQTCINLEKTGPETVQAGETITYHFIVTNCGDVVLDSGAQVYDPLIDPSGRPIWKGVLQPGQVVEFDRTYTTTFAAPDIDCGDLVNTATAVGHPTDPSGVRLPNVTDEDSWTVEVVCEPVTGIDIEKYVRGETSDYFAGCLCAEFGKPEVLTMLYTGANVESHSQDPCKVTIIGDPDFDSQVYIVASDKSDPNHDKAKIFFAGSVGLGETFAIDAAAAGDSKLKAETHVYIFADSHSSLPLQTIRFHTSCSQPLFLGDQFGGITLVSFLDEDGQGAGIGGNGGASGIGHDADEPTGPAIPVGERALFTYVVTNTGWAELDGVAVLDDNETPDNTGDDFAPDPVLASDGLYNIGDTDRDGQLDAGEAWLYTADATVTELGQHVNIATATGTPVDAGGVPIGDDVTDTDPACWLAEVPASSIHGIVWDDSDNDGEIDSGEEAIEGVTVKLTGKNDRNEAVDLVMATDEDGVYIFTDLRPSDAAGYAIEEFQPAGYDDGQDVLGTVDGLPMGFVDGNDRFAGIVLGPGQDGEDYNFGEQQTACGDYVTAGQTATIGFWRNKHGQRLIKSLNGGQNSTQLSTYLAETFPNMYGKQAGKHDLTGKTNAEVARFYRDLFKQYKKHGRRHHHRHGAVKLDPQAMALALATYVTNESLAGTVAQQFGFITSATGVGSALFDVDAALGAGSAETLFGAGTSSTLSVQQIMLLTDSQTSNGLLFDTDANGKINRAEKSLRSLANELFTAINEAGDIR